MTRGTVAELCSALSLRLVAAVALEDVLFKLNNFSAFVFHAQTVTGLGRGVCIASVLVLSLCRAAAAASLLAPSLRQRLAEETALVALAAGELATSAFLVEFSDASAASKSIFLSTALFVILLMSRSERARSRWVGAPVLDRLLSAEYWLRVACTRLRAALWLLPFAAMLALKCALVHRYWAYRGAHFEAHRTLCARNLAACALLVGVAAEDRSTQRFDALLEGWRGTARQAFSRAAGRLCTGG